MKKKPSAIKKKQSTYKQRLAAQEWLKLDPEHRQTLLARQKLFPNTEEADQTSPSLEGAGMDLLSTINAFEDELSAIETSPHSLQTKTDASLAEPLSWRGVMKDLMSNAEQDPQEVDLSEISFGDLLDAIDRERSEGISDEAIFAFVDELEKLKEAHDTLGTGQVFFVDLGLGNEMLPKELKTDNPIVMPVHLASKQMEEKIMEKRKDKSVTFVPPSSCLLYISPSPRDTR